MVCLGLGGRSKHTLQDNPILQARILTVEGSSSTLGVNYTFGEVRPSLGRRRGPRISTPKDNVIATPGPSLPGSSPGIRPEQAARPVTPGPRPAALQQGRQSGLSRRLGWWEGARTAVRVGGPACAANEFDVTRGPLPGEPTGLLRDRLSLSLS